MIAEQTPSAHSVVEELALPLVTATAGCERDGQQPEGEPPAGALMETTRVRPAGIGAKGGVVDFWPGWTERPE